MRLEAISRGKKHILLVDDNIGDIILTKDALKNLSFINEIWVARDGVEAMQILRSEGKFIDMPRPDLVLLDLNMPRMNGFEVLAEMKADKNLCLIPVIILTSSEADDDISRAYQNGAALDHFAGSLGAL